MKLLSEIQYKAEERKRQVTKSQEVTTYQLPVTVHSRAGIRTHHTGNSTSLHSTCAASADYHRTACYSDCESTATIRASIIVSTATSYVVVDDQQSGTSRQMIFNPPSVAPCTHHEHLRPPSQSSQHSQSQPKSAD